VKLLFDENLSPTLVQSLDTTYPNSAHIENVSLRGASDQRIWDHAQLNGFAVVSKDTDSRDRSALESFRSKVTWLAVGNAGTMAISDPLRHEGLRILAFDADPESSTLVLSLDPNAG
jgi:predicted nuclease of predicted toxin-antitoxin system